MAEGNEPRPAQPINTANVSGTTDTRGNVNSGIGSGKLVIGFVRDSNGYDGIYVPFHSPAGVPYIHVTDWDGAKATSVSVSGTVYYIVV